MEGAGAQGHRPVDAAQPVAGAEGQDVRELGAATRPGATVLADEADGVGESGPRGEGAGVGTVATVSVSWAGHVQANEAKSPNPPTGPGRAGARPSGRCGRRRRA